MAWNLGTSEECARYAAAIGAGVFHPEKHEGHVRAERRSRDQLASGLCRRGGEDDSSGNRVVHRISECIIDLGASYSLVIETWVIMRTWKARKRLDGKISVMSALVLGTSRKSEDAVIARRRPCVISQEPFNP